MYCPYCKNELKIVSGELYCQKGKCYFSKNVSKKFKSPPNQHVESITNEVGSNGKFFCVICGKPMRRIDPMKEICLYCGFKIDKALYYEIIELNPHE
jgi:hypothetical protein